MSSKKHRQEMVDYLGAQFQAGGHKVAVKSKELVAGAPQSHYLTLDDADSCVFLVDAKYTDKRFRKIKQALQQQYKDRNAFVFLKNGTDFFRSYARKGHFKADDRSLKNYTPEQVGRIMLLTPEEKLVVPGQLSHVSGGPSELFYYQPDSARLDEKVIGHSFQPVRLDYSHIDSNSQFKPSNTDSKRMYIHGATSTEYDGALRLEARIITSV